jgi:branched-subunit amino acid transport protein
MSPVVMLLLGAAGTYVMRVMFINLVPAGKLPTRVRTTLQLVGPAALAALIATDIAHATAHPVTLWPTLGAVAVAGIAALLTKNLALTILGGLAAGIAVSLLW